MKMAGIIIMVPEYGDNMNDFETAYLLEYDIDDAIETFEKNWSNGMLVSELNQCLSYVYTEQLYITNNSVGMLIKIKNPEHDVLNLRFWTKWFTGYHNVDGKKEEKYIERLVLPSIFKIDKDFIWYIFKIDEDIAKLQTDKSCENFKIDITDYYSQNLKVLEQTIINYTPSVFLKNSLSGAGSGSGGVWNEYTYINSKKEYFLSLYNSLITFEEDEIPFNNITQAQADAQNEAAEAEARAKAEESGEPYVEPEEIVSNLYDFLEENHTLAQCWNEYKRLLKLFEIKTFDLDYTYDGLVIDVNSKNKSNTIYKATNSNSDTLSKYLDSHKDSTNTTITETPRYIGNEFSNSQSSFKHSGIKKEFINPTMILVGDAKGDFAKVEDLVAAGLIEVEIKVEDWEESEEYEMLVEDAKAEAGMEDCYRHPRVNDKGEQIETPTHVDWGGEDEDIRYSTTEYLKLETYENNGYTKGEKVVTVEGKTYPAPYATDNGYIECDQVNEEPRYWKNEDNNGIQWVLDERIQGNNTYENQPYLELGDSGNFEDGYTWKFGGNVLIDQIGDPINDPNNVKRTYKLNDVNVNKIDGVWFSEERIDKWTEEDPIPTNSLDEPTHHKEDGEYISGINIYVEDEEGSKKPFYLSYEGTNYNNKKPNNIDFIEDYLTYSDKFEKTGTGTEEDPFESEYIAKDAFGNMKQDEKLYKYERAPDEDLFRFYDIGTYKKIEGEPSYSKLSELEPDQWYCPKTLIKDSCQADYDEPEQPDDWEPQVFYYTYYLDEYGNRLENLYTYRIDGIDYCERGRYRIWWIHRNTEIADYYRYNLDPATEYGADSWSGTLQSSSTSLDYKVDWNLWSKRWQYPIICPNMKEWTHDVTFNGLPVTKENELDFVSPTDTKFNIISNNAPFGEISKETATGYDKEFDFVKGGASYSMTKNDIIHFKWNYTDEDNPDNNRTREGNDGWLHSVQCSFIKGVDDTVAEETEPDE